MPETTDKRQALCCGSGSVNLETLEIFHLALSDTYVESTVVNRQIKKKNTRKQN